MSVDKIIDRYKIVAGLEFFPKKEFKTDCDQPHKKGKKREKKREASPKARVALRGWSKGQPEKERYRGMEL